MAKRNIHPLPRNISYREGYNIFGEEITVRVGGKLTDDVVSVWEELTRNFTSRFSRLNVEYDPSLPPFCAATGSAAPTVPAAGDEEYRLVSDENGISMSASSLNGLRYSFYTFLQLLQRRGDDTITGFAAPYCEIDDSPAMAFRGIHICIFPDTALDLIEKYIMLTSFMKFNYMIIEIWGAVRLDTFPCWKDVGYTKEELKPLINKARAMGLEVIPLFNSLGHAPASRDAMGHNVIMEVKPEWIPFFEPYEYDWCISNPAVRPLLAKIRKELYDLFGESEYFHIGGDEAFFLATCDRCAEKPFIPLVSDYLNALCDDIAKEGRRPMIWSDMFLDLEDWKDHEYIFANSHPEKPTKELLSTLDRRYIITDWQYAVTKEDRTAAHFMEKGFDTILCPFRHPGNVEALAASAKAEKTKGVLLTTWSHQENLLHLMSTQASLLWNEGSPSFIQPTIISTALLRRLCPSDGNYATAGWLHDHRQVDG